MKFVIYFCITAVIVEANVSKRKLITNKYELINLRVGPKFKWDQGLSNVSYGTSNLSSNEGIVNPVISNGTEIGFRLHLLAFNQTFALNVVFSPKYSRLVDKTAQLVIYGKDKVVKSSLIGNSLLSKFFVGSAIGQLRCKVKGDVRSDDLTKIRAKVSCPAEDFHLEPAEEHIQYENPNGMVFTSILYRMSEVVEDVCPLLKGNGSRPCLFDGAIGILSNLTENEQIVSTPSRKSRVRSRVMAQDYRGKVCGMHLVADHTYHRFFGHNEGNVLREILTNFQEGDQMFRATDFNGDGHPDGIGLKVKRISIFKDNGDSYFNSQENVKSNRVLDILSHWAAYQGDYCLTMLFLHRDFEPEHVIGLAWVGRPNQMLSIGGLCEITRHQRDKGYVRMNTALVTNINGGRILPSAINTITFTHEVGHNFGAEHDETECNYPNQVDNYIMLPAANYPTSAKNKMFSPCSIAMILPVIRNKGGCLEVDHGPRCGDGVLQEQHEQCDCGTTLEECQAIDPCCVEAHSRSEQPCTLRRGAVCTPMRSACCDSSCQISGDGKPCMTNGDPCMKNKVCDGQHFDCLKGTMEPDGTACSGTSMVCVGGRCDRTWCALRGLYDCECLDPDTQMCSVCCVNQQGHCIPADAMEPIRGVRRLRSPGSSCSQGAGSCTAEGHCGQTMGMVLEAGTDFDDVTPTGSWFVNNWYYFLIAAFIVVLGIVLCIGLGIFRRRRKKVNELKEGMATAQKKIQKHPQGKKLSRRLQAQAARLANFFPSVATEEIIAVSQKEIPEVEMIEELRAKGYPMKQTFFIGKVDNPKKVKEDKNSSGSKGRDKRSKGNEEHSPRSSKESDEGHQSGSSSDKKDHKDGKHKSKSPK